MASSNTGTAYEVSLSGSFFAKDLNPILNRITLNSESSQPIHTREVVFEPLNAQEMRALAEGGGGAGGMGLAAEPVMLRAKREMAGWDPARGGEGPPWEMYSYLKPESARTYPDATVRPWANVQVIGDALSFAAALGYIRKTQLYKRGYSFRRGPLVIVMFQQEQVDPKTSKPIPAHPDTLWEVEVKTAAPIKSGITAVGGGPAARGGGPNSLSHLGLHPSGSGSQVMGSQGDTPVRQAIELVLEVQTLMKGLLDLRRQDF